MKDRALMALKLLFHVSISIFTVNNCFALDLDLNEAIGLALSKSERNMISQEEINKVLTEYRKIRSGIFPTIAINAGITKLEADPALFVTQDGWQKNWSLSLDQSIYTFGRLSSALDISESKKQLSQISKKLTESEIIKAVKILYFSALYTKELYNISEESFKNAKENKNALKSRVSFGRISRHDNLKMEADLASRSPSLIEAQKLFSSALLDLKNFMGVDPDEEINLKGSLKLVNENNNSEFNILKNLHLKILSEQIQLTQYSIDLAKSDYYPIVSLFSTYSPSYYGEAPFGESVFDQTNLSIGLKISFAWPTGGEIGHEVELQRINKRISELNYNSAQRNIKIKYKKLNSEIEYLRDKLRATTNAVTLSESAYKIALSSFRNGNISQTQLSDSDLLLTQNKLNRAQNILQLNLLAAELEYISSEGKSRSSL